MISQFKMNYILRLNTCPYAATYAVLTSRDYKYQCMVEVYLGWENLTTYASLLNCDANRASANIVSDI